jgi:hypothetical protein
MEPTRSRALGITPQSYWAIRNRHRDLFSRDFGYEKIVPQGIQQISANADGSADPSCGFFCSDVGFGLRALEDVLIHCAQTTASNLRAQTDMPSSHQFGGQRFII